PGGQLTDDFPSIGAVLSRLGRGSGPLPPFVAMMPVVSNGAPRFVEQTHGQGAGWLGPLYQPMRIDADASLPDYRVAELALLDDLEQRGLLDETLVVWTGEMGRTPRVGQAVVGGAGAGRDGRDHWGRVFTSVLAGGGVQGGVVHGSSDRYAAEPSTHPTAP